MTLTTEPRTPPFKSITLCKYIVGEECCENVFILSLCIYKCTHTNNNNNNSNHARFCHWAVKILCFPHASGNEIIALYIIFLRLFSLFFSSRRCFSFLHVQLYCMLLLCIYSIRTLIFTPARAVNKQIKMKREKPLTQFSNSFLNSLLLLFSLLLFILSIIGIDVVIVVAFA